MVHLVSKNLTVSLLILNTTTSIPVLDRPQFMLMYSSAPKESALNEMLSGLHLEG